jgi:putative tryptophan/tyrosine transport system substrate-binding protein
MLLGPLALALFLLAPLGVEAQQTGKMHRIGYLSGGTPSSARTSALVEAFRDGLRELGYVEGRNLTIEWRFSEGRGEQFPALANELSQLKVEAIVTTGGPATRAAKQATNTIPIVMAFSGDPVGTGLVASIARPGGNLTGLSFMSPELSAKRLELLREAFPKVTRVATLWNPDDPVYALELQRTEAAARGLGISLQPIEVRGVADFEAAFASMARHRADALIVFAHTLTILNQRRLVELANRDRLPTMYGLREFVTGGGLIAYGPSLSALYRRAAFYVDRIFKGAKPADLPVEQPTKFELLINLKTAKALGLTIPPSLLLRADHVIE